MLIYVSICVYLKKIVDKLTFLPKKIVMDPKMAGVIIFKPKMLNIIPYTLFQNNLIFTGLKITIIFKKIHQISKENSLKHK